MTFKYKGEEIIVEFNSDKSINWVYAYNMRMKMAVVPYDLKQEILYLISKQENNQ